MLKRLGLFTVSLVLMFAAIPVTMAGSDCDFSYSNHARAAQLHAMGDLAGALPYYDCALENDPDNYVLRTIVNDLHHEAGDQPVFDSEMFCDDSVNHLEIGFNLRGRGELTDALVHLECALQENPYDASLWMSIGNIYGNLGDTDRAQYFFNRSGTGLIFTETSVISNSTCDPTINHYEHGVALRAEGNFQQALSHFYCELEVNPNDAEVLMMVGNIHGNLGDMRAAQYYFDRSGTGIIYHETSNMQTSDCDPAISHHADGAQLYAMGNYQDALSSFECALVNNPDSTSVLMMLANTYIKQDNYEVAHDYLSQAIAIEDAYAPLYTRRAFVSYKLENYQSALNDINAVLRLHPDNDPALEIRAMILEAMGRDAEFAQVSECDSGMSQFATGSQLHAMGDLNRAMEAYHCALNFNPENKAVMIQLAQVYTQMEEYEQALTYLDRALDIDRNNIFILSQRGHVHYLLGNYTAGLADVQRALRWNPDFASALETRELILMASIAEQRDIGIISGVTSGPSATPAPSNAGKNALPQLDDATEMAVVPATEAEPTSPTAETLLTAAEAFVYQGKFAQAIEQYEALLGFQPNNPDVHFALAHAHFALEEFATALPYLEQTLELDPGDLYATYYLAATHSKLNHRHEALTIMDDLYANGRYDGSYSLVMGHVYSNLGYDDIAGIQFYDWMTDRQSMRLPTNLSVSTNDTEIVMDYGVLYEIPFSATAGQVVQIDVKSHILNPNPIDPLIVVLNEAGIPVAGDDDDGELFDSSLNFVPPTTGDYTLIVSHAGGKHAGELDVQLTGNTWSADAYREAGTQAWSNEKYALAIELLNRAIAIDGGIAEDYALLGRIYLRMGDLDSSAVMYSQALELDPTRADVRCDLGAIYATWGDTDDALKQFDIILSTNPTDSCAWTHRDALLQQQRTANNATSANPIIEPLSTSPADDLYELGLQYKADQLIFSAANTFLQATVVDPTHDLARCELAQIQLDWSNYTGAIRSVNTILANNPDNTCALTVQANIEDKTGRIFSPMTATDFLNRGMKYYNNGDLDNAISAFQKALELDPVDKVSRCYLGIAYADNGQYAEAFYQWDISLTQDSINPDPCAWSNQRALANRLDEMQADSSASTANAEVEIVAPTAPSPAEGIYQEGLNKLELGKEYGASTAFLRAISIDPTHLGARCELAKLDLAWGNYYHASQGYLYLLDQDPTNECALAIRVATIDKRNQMYVPTSVNDFVVRGDRYYSIGEVDRALESYLVALKLEPARYELRCRVGMIYGDLGQYEEAMVQFNRVLSQDTSNHCARNHRRNIQRILRESETIVDASTSTYLNDLQSYSDEILVRDVYGYESPTNIDNLYDISLSMGVRSLMHEAQTRHESGDVWTASALLDRYIDDNYATMCKGELRWLADEYRAQGFTVMADMMHLKAIGDSTC